MIRRREIVNDSIPLIYLMFDIHVKEKEKDGGKIEILS